MLTTGHGCCAFESASALPSVVIRGYETTSSNEITFYYEMRELRESA
jgi:hypothetical protein